MRRRTRPLPAWWPEGRPWPPASTVEQRSVPAWWPAGESWRARRRTRIEEVPRGFPIGIAILLAAAINVVALGVLALARATISAVPWPNAWPVSAAVLVTLTALVFMAAMRWIASPLSQIVAAAHRVGNGDFAVRLDEEGLPWIRSLAAAFNTMTGRLDRQHRERRALMADIAHELRTPVAVMQGRLEGIVDGVYPSDGPHVRQVLEQTHMLARLIEDLRTSAHAEGGTLPLHREPTDVGLLVEDVARDSRALAERRGIRIETHLASEAPSLELDPQRIREVLSNLVSNAIRHSPDGGTVLISCEPEGAGNVVIRVSDRGTGIPDADLARVFARFYKSPDSPGSGLGLAIAKSLVEAHGGTIAAANRHGGGTVATVALPARLLSS